MNPPTHVEFVIAREESNDSERGEDAYQVCRWFRGQMFQRRLAERWLKSHRAARSEAALDPRSLEKKS